jgi:Ras-related protein Rab-2A
MGYSTFYSTQAGQETFKSITRSYYRGSIGVILVYDITNRESFNNIAKWLDETKAYANDKVTACLIANKTDLESK